MKKMSYKKNGYTLIEIMLVIGIILFISTITFYYGMIGLKKAQANKSAEEISAVLKGAGSLAIFNSPDGSTQNANPINIELLDEYKLLPDSFSKFANEDYYNPEIGQISINYSAEYPKANVIELNIRNMNEYLCRRIIDISQARFLEVKMDNKYLPHKKVTSSTGEVSYRLDPLKGSVMCSDMVNNTNANGIIKIRYFVSPDISKLYTVGGDIAGTSDPKAGERNAQIKKFTDAHKYVEDIKQAHILTNIVN